ncbi:integrase core domain-containing protein, partial [Mycobacterium intracellulare]|uniref:integrase core domain-containing protein n=1 Tax=Mycobacterium intracellulare TaxID=1767 RepID=UPI00211C0E20
PSPKGSNATKNNSASSPSHPDDEPFRSTARPRELRLAGQSSDNALAETVNGYYKAELIYGPARTGPWKTVEDVELATLGWVNWHNTSRLHSYLADVSPTEFEAAFYDAQRTDQPLIGIQ